MRDKNDIPAAERWPQNWTYEGRLFRPVHSSAASQTSFDTVFRYHQKGPIISGEYSGGEITFGHLLGLVDASGQIDMRYHHISASGQIMTGICRSRPELMESGKLRLLERWQWTCGEKSTGTSILEEM